MSGPTPTGRREFRTGFKSLLLAQLVGINDTCWPTGLQEDLRLQPAGHSGLDSYSIE
jgi:hypothetical protein